MEMEKRGPGLDLRGGSEWDVRDRLQAGWFRLSIDPV
jgi:hypothetical protein